MSFARVFADSIEARIKSLDPSTALEKEKAYGIIKDYEGNVNLLLPHQRARISKLIESLSRILDDGNESVEFAIKRRDRITTTALACDLRAFSGSAAERGIFSDGRKVEHAEQLMGNVLLESIKEATLDIPIPLAALTIHDCHDVSIRAHVSGPILMRNSSNLTLTSTSTQLRLSKCHGVTLECVVETPIACEECTELTSLNADMKIVHL
jgi:tubulin binding cofactor C